MCRASCHHGAVWTANSDKSTKLGKRVGTNKKSLNYNSRGCIVYRMYRLYYWIYKTRENLQEHYKKLSVRQKVVVRPSLQPLSTKETGNTDKEQGEANNEDEMVLLPWNRGREEKGTARTM
jgi:hypothetical protein